MQISNGRRFRVAARGVAKAVRVALAAAGVAAIAVPTARLASQVGGVAPAAPVKAPGAAPAAGGVDQARIAKGRELFGTWSCNSCHALADAGANGHVGPELDGDASLTEALVVNRVTNGQGPMPSFGGQMSDEEIATLAYYVAHVAKK